MVCDMKMEQEEILELVNSLKICDEFDGGDVSLDTDVDHFDEKKLQFCLVCKVISTKEMPREVFRAQVRN